MAWTYSGDPATSNRDAVRFLIGDTNTKRQLFQHEELSYLLTQNNSNVRSAAAAALEAKISEFSLYGRGRLGSFEFDFKDTIAEMNILLQNLRVSGTASRLLWAGGISEAEKEVDQEDVDLIQPRFRRGHHDNLVP